MKDPKNFYPRYTESNCADCCRYYYTNWGKVRQANYEAYIPSGNDTLYRSSVEKGFYPIRCTRVNSSGLMITQYGLLEASGALSLGTTAGTNRSISAEFGGTTPHGLSEYYDAASGIPASGVIDFSDFHGKSAAATPPDPPDTDCLWTHYDTFSCAVGVCCFLQTSSHAMCTQCLCIGHFREDCKVIFLESSTGVSSEQDQCYNPQFCIVQNECGHDVTAWLFPFCNTACSKDETAFWGTGSEEGNYPNTVLMVYRMDHPAGAWAQDHGVYRNYVIERWNSGYDGRVWDNYQYFRPFYSGYLWQTYKVSRFQACTGSSEGNACRWYVYGSDCGNYSGYWRACSTGRGETDSLTPIFHPIIKGHRVFSPITGNCWQMTTSTACNLLQLTWLTKTSSINNCGRGYDDGDWNGDPWCGSTNQGFTGIEWDTYSNRWMMHRARIGEGGKDFINGTYNRYRTAPSSTNSCYRSRVSSCFCLMEYFHYQCALTDTQMCNLMEHLRNKWYCNCYVP